LSCLVLNSFFFGFGEVFMQCSAEEFQKILAVAIESGYFRAVAYSQAAQQINQHPSSPTGSQTFLEVLQACPMPSSLTTKDLALPFSLHPAPSPPQLEAAQIPVVRAIEQSPETVIQEGRAIGQATSPKRSFPLSRLLLYYLGLSCLGALLFLGIRGNPIGIGAIENSLNGLNPSNPSPSPSASPTPVSSPKSTPSPSASPISSTIDQRVQQLITQPAVP
jgi:hypothetical protein